jgi:peptidoglycan/LPS O-acetylase OafA/YrhL
MGTLGIQLAKTGGRPAGFDYLRLGLSIGIVAYHSFVVCYGWNGKPGLGFAPAAPLCGFLVPAFFALSGFLVAGSLQRNDLPSFLTLRALRIFPALCVEVILSAVVLGALFTTLPLHEYFMSPMFRAYFLNILGDIHFYLPGVFENLPDPNWVNLQLWTIPFELRCYIGLSLLALLRMHKRPMLYMAFVMAIWIAPFAQAFVTHPFHLGHGQSPGRLAVLSFLFGVGLYNLRDRIPFSWTGFTVAAVLCYVLLYSPATSGLASLPIAYVTVFLGLCNPPRSFFVLGADYSYGIYLYGFPIQQSIVFLLPDARIWYVNLVLSLIVVSCFAAFSWHFIENPVLGRKKEAVRFVQGFALSHPILRKLFQWEISWGRHKIS